MKKKIIFRLVGIGAVITTLTAVPSSAKYIATRLLGGDYSQTMTWTDNTTANGFDLIYSAAINLQPATTGGSGGVEVTLSNCPAGWYAFRLKGGDGGNGNWDSTWTSGSDHTYGGTGGTVSGMTYLSGGTLVLRAGTRGTDGPGSGGQWGGASGSNGESELDGGGGGGYSGIFYTTAQTNPIAVAGGGGGGGGGNDEAGTTDDRGGNGGNGASAASNTGTAATIFPGSNGVAGGGNNEYGVGGYNGTGTYNSDGGGGGGQGSPYTGGSAESNSGGGGGGAGYYGGEGGGCRDNWYYGGGGGGGGASYLQAAVKAISVPAQFSTMLSAGTSGNGYVSIVYLGPADPTGKTFTAG
jgi:hypothetical protein